MHIKIWLMSFRYKKLLTGRSLQQLLVRPDPLNKAAFQEILRIHVDKCYWHQVVNDTLSRYLSLKIERPATKKKSHVATSSEDLELNCMVFLNCPAFQEFSRFMLSRYLSLKIGRTATKLAVNVPRV